MTLAAGIRLGPYQIVASLGAGGMGEVYRARDTKLGRDVALKVLPEAFSRDTDRLARFEREARVLATLNHPHIAMIYGLEEFDGIRFLVLELIEGETLQERISRGPLVPGEALPLARQIAEALEAAHEKGVIHRDLKPANIKLAEEGKAKLLDFGLAKALGEELPSQDATLSPTVTSGGTRYGVILGTAAYMSPEQARGRTLDRRTDIWSFGCVLFEMLAGRKVFEGETASDAIARILEREPQWQLLPASVPEKIRNLLRRCLRKEARQRLHDIADARIEIEEVLGGSAVGEAEGRVGTRSPRPVSAMMFGAGLLAAALVGSVVTWIGLRQTGAGAEETNPHVIQVARLTHDPGLSEWPTWSPDGSLLAFTSNRSGNLEIYVRRVDGGQEVDVTNDPSDDTQPAFSPDGKSLAFVSTRSSRTGLIKIGGFLSYDFRTYGGDIWIAPALGGQARRLAQNANFPAWSPDGKRIAYVSGLDGHRTILEIPQEGGEPKLLLPASASKWEIVRLQYSPGGDWLCFSTSDPDRILLFPVAGGEPRELVSGSFPVWDNAGERLYFTSRNPQGGTRLQEVSVDLARGTLRGKPGTIGLMTGILRDLALSRDGRQLAVSELEGAMNLTLQPLTADGSAAAGPEVPLSRGQVIDGRPAFSPEGKRIAYTSDRLGKQEFWIIELSSGRQDRLEFPGGDLGGLRMFWFPDGRQILASRMFETPSGLTYSIWLAAIDGSHTQEILSVNPWRSEFALSPDGGRIAYLDSTGNRKQLFSMDLKGHEPRQLTSSAGDKADPIFSWDGRWIAFTSDETGTRQVYRMPAEGGTALTLTSGSERMKHLSFSPDNRWIYVQPNHRNVWRIPVAGGPLQPVTQFPESGLFLEEPTLSHDGRMLAYCRNNSLSSLWLLTVGQDPRDASR